MRTRIEILVDIRKTQARSNRLKTEIEEIRKRMPGIGRDSVLEKDAEVKTDALNETQSLLSKLQRELETRKRKGARHLRTKVPARKKNSVR